MPRGPLEGLGQEFDDRADVSSAQPALGYVAFQRHLFVQLDFHYYLFLPI
jgi:hypothetical protein